MLQSLKIKNIALINEAIVEFNKGLNILTGETGAGKSIIIDALTFVLGSRADKSLIKNGCDFAMVEAVFDLDGLNDDINEFFNSANIEPESTIIISRKLNSLGKNECRVNGEVVTLNMLKKLTTNLVDIHGQFDHQLLMDLKTHIKLLDLFGKNEIYAEKTKLDNNIKIYNDIVKEIESIGGVGLDRERNIDLYRYQINEIEVANLKVDEDKELNNIKNKFLNSAKLVDNLSNSVDDLYNGNYNSLMSLSSAISSLSNIENLDNDIANFKERLVNAKYEIEDVAESLKDYLRTIDFSEDELNEIEDRLDLIKDLVRKYSKSNDIQGVIDYYNEAKLELDKLLNADELLNSLLNKKKDILKIIYDNCKSLTDIRKKYALILQDKLLNELKELGMEKSSFIVSFDNDYNLENIEDKFTMNGADNVEYLFSANAGVPVKSLNKIISGGELSRFMLAFKCVVSGSDYLKTFVFDEIDTGIGGNVGNILGKKLYSISINNQVFCITHLAQIACYADSHYKVKKYERDNKTYVDVKPLNLEERYVELDRMIGGGSEYSKLHAINLIDESNKIKNNVI